MPFFICVAVLFFLTVPAYAQDSAEQPVPPAETVSQPPLEIEDVEDFPVDEVEEESEDSTPDESAVSVKENVPAGKVDTGARLPAAEVPLPVDGSKDAVQFSDEPERNYTNTATLQGLNKITARTSALVVPVGLSTRFGNLEIFVRLCWKSSPEEAPDSKALLEVLEQKPGEEKKQIFYGWMFASSPALSALEHPVYDITVIECKQADKK